MNHVIIIDDEIQSRNGIAEIFRNHSPSWNVSGLFEDGFQALKYLQRHPEIDLIVTDIRMPKFDGLELISKIRKTNGTIPIIIISGYSEFSYAKKAVDYHVFRYVLKPVLPSEFDGIITSVENFFQLNTPLMKHDFAQTEYEQFMDLLFAEAIALNKKQTLYMLEKQCGFSFQDAWFLLIDGNSEFSSHIFRYRPLLQHFCTRITSEYHVFLFRQKIYCILLKKQDTDDKTIEKQVQKLLWQFERKLGAHVGIYHSTQDERLKNAFYSGISALKQHFYSKTPIHVYQDQLLCPFPYSLYNNLQLQLTGGSLLDVRDAIYSFIDYVKSKQPSYFELNSWIDRITLIITKYCNDNKISSACYIDFAESLQFLYNYYSLEEIEDTLLSMIDSIFDKISEQKTSTNTYLVEQVQTYLTQHANENITLSELGDILGTNYASLSSIYSSATGQTIIEYLTTLKISLAKELLINTDKKIYEICTEIGYSDPKYFIKRFRQVVGVTPKEYRKIYTS